MALGEREIIKRLIKRFKVTADLPVPFGDDVSAYPLNDKLLMVLKTDMLVGATDVPPGMSLWQAARKAVVMNVSDFAAKGVAPKAMVVSLGLPCGLSISDVEALGNGLNDGALEYGVQIVGGDTNEASDLIISVALSGVAEKSELILRSGAKPGDMLAVTGLFGKTSAGLKILLDGLEAPETLKSCLLESVYMPRARLKEGLALKASGAVTASIDSSDGLAWSLHEIAEASHVGFIVDTVPIAPEAERFAEISGLDPYELVFYGGEEYELILTVNPKLWAVAEKAIRGVGGSLIRIGEAVAEPGIKLKAKNSLKSIEPKGWEHFRKI